MVALSTVFMYSIDMTTSAQTRKLGVPTSKQMRAQAPIPHHYLGGDAMQAPIFIARLPNAPQKGRGSVSGIVSRFDAVARELNEQFFNDVLVNHESCDSESPKQPTTQLIKQHIKTTTRIEIAKSIISRNQSPDIPFEQSINPYRGCEHGCVYCYARPTHSYLGLSPGLDFETQLTVKVNAVQLLKQELSNPKYVVSPINLGAATDCYQPIEREHQITRQILQLLSDCNHPVTIVTKSALVTRDIDILSGMAKRGLARVFISVTSLDADLSRVMEPRAAAPWRRIKAIEQLVKAGIPVGVLVAPIIPFINEPEIEQIIAACTKAGASSCHYTVLRLPYELSNIFRIWLAAHFPDRAERVLHRVQEMRGGRDNNSNFKTRMKGEGVWAELIRARFHSATRRAGCQTRRVDLSIDQFIRPVPVALNSVAANPVAPNPDACNQSGDLSSHQGVSRRVSKAPPQLPVPKPSRHYAREAVGQLPLLF